MRGILHHEDWGWSNAPRFGGSAPSGSTTTTQTNQPWSGEEPYLQGIYGAASNNYTNATPQYYPDNTYAPLTGTQTGLMNQLIGYGAGGGNSAINGANSAATNIFSPDYTAQTQGTFGRANDVLGNELSPGYLNPWNSPAFGTVVNNTLASVLPQTTASFINGGRSDSGLATAAATQAATNAVGNLAQQQYDQNQQIQQNAAQQGANNYLQQTGQQVQESFFAPMIDQAQASDINTGLNAAGMAQTNAQNQTNANLARWNYNQMLPWNQLGLYEGAVTGTGNPGGTSTTSQPYFQNPTANALSGATGLGILGLLGTKLFAAL